MKKFLVLMAALALVFAFVACGDDDDPVTPPASSSSVASTSSTASSGSSNSTASSASSSVASSTSSATSSSAPIYIDADPSTTAGAHTAGTATGLFISEYFEGFSNDKYLEIYNGTGASIALSRIKLTKYNWSGTPSAYKGTQDFVLNDTAGYDTGVTIPTDLAAGATLVIYNNSLTAARCPNAVAVGLKGAAYLGTAPITQVIAFNGDDGLSLSLDGTIVDVIGALNGSDIGFPASAAPLPMADKKLIRKANKGADANPWASATIDTTVWDNVAFMTGITP